MYIGYLSEEMPPPPPAALKPPEQRSGLDLPPSPKRVWLRNPTPKPFLSSLMGNQGGGALGRERFMENVEVQ